MSIKYLTYAFDARVNNPLRKLVLLKLCDNANDSGECWPSFSHIADQCEISRRSAINHIQALIADGYLSSEARFKSGEQTSNMYLISKVKLLGSAGFAPPSESPAPPLVQELHPPSAGAAPRTVTEPSIGNVSEPVLPLAKTATPKSPFNGFDYSSWPSLPTDQTMTDWVAMRKRLKANVSQTVINRFASELRKAATYGYSVDQCLSECVTRNWRGFEVQWMLNSQQGNNGQPKGQYKTAAEKEAERNAYTFNLERARDF